MKAEIISIGTELLLGSIVNTNAAFLAGRLAQLGITCYYQSVVGDNAKRLKELLKESLKRSDIIIMTGGLGPTQDDLTKETAARLMGLKLVEDKAWRKRLESFFKSRNLEITDNNYKQALVPEGALVLDNPNGTAPGIIIEDKKAKKALILLPGPPIEMEPMFDAQVYPYLEGKEPTVIRSQTVKLCGVGESKAETMVLDLINDQVNPTIATYAKTGEVHIRVTAGAPSEKEALKLIKPVVKELKERFKDKVYSTQEDMTLERAVVELLKANDLTVVTAESCTGGMLASKLTDVAGVSEVFKTGYVTYSNKAKHRILGVRNRTLDKYGAVSAETVKEMAKGAAAASKADVAVAISGIAGPDGGSDEKPVGLVYIGVCIGKELKVKEYNFSGNRRKIRESAVMAALTLMRNFTLEYYSLKTFGGGKK